MILPTTKNNTNHPNKHPLYKLSTLSNTEIYDKNNRDYQPNNGNKICFRGFMYT